jgi:cytochrome c-type biogenesis protein CcmH
MKITKLYLIVFIFIFTHMLQLKSDENNILKNKITKNIRCLICQGQSVYDSDSEFASSLKIVVQNKINAGFSEQEIYEFLKKKYGEWILYDPELNKNTYILWLLPILLFLFGGAIIYTNLIIKKK